MTTQRRNRLIEKLRRSRSRILEADTALGMLLMYLRFVAVPSIQKITTDGITVYINPDFLDKLGESEVDYLLLHQLFHILRGDLWYSGSLSMDAHHLTCDAEINKLLLENDLAKPSYRHLGVLHLPEGTRSYVQTRRGSFPTAYTAYSLHLLPKTTRSKYFPDGDDGWTGGHIDLEKSELLIDIPEFVHDRAWESAGSSSSGNGDGDGDGDKGVSQNTHGRWLARMSEMQSMTSASMAGKCSLLEALNLGRASAPILDWRTLLQDFLQEMICDYSFSPPDRRFGDFDFFLPDFNEKDFTVKEILFMVDTSASVDLDQLACVYEEICSAVMQFNGKLEAKLGFFDTAVAEPVPFSSVRDVRAIVPRGGGGTDFFAVFEYIAGLSKRPACIVIFSDGYAEFPLESAALGIPVLWLMDNMDVTPPWGQVARTVKEEND